MTRSPAPECPDHARAPWLTRNLRIVSAVSLTQDAASELLYPVMPIFLTAVLGAPAAAVGIVEGIAEAASAVTKLISGRLADRFPRKPLIGLGYGLAALGKAMVAVAGAWPVVLAGRGIDRLGKGLRGAPRDALIVADVPPRARGRAFGFHRAMDTTGAVIGPLAGLALYHLLQERIRPLLLIALVPAVASTLLVLALREPVRRPAPRPASGWGSLLAPGRLPSRYWTVVAVLAGFALVNFPDALLLLRLYEIGFSVPGVIGAYVLFNLAYATLSLPAGALADRLSPATVFGIGLGCFAVAYLGLGLTRSPVVALVLLVGYGGFAAGTDGVGKAWISRLLPEHLQGSGQGVFQCLTGLGVLLAGLWAGLAWGADGTVPLLVSGAVAATIALPMMGWGLRTRAPRYSSEPTPQTTGDQGGS
ncbi:MAG: MFS transporter [Dactylosporangium sp.]|nr:MFS transporter [Dactylosporangium sp.]NNJ63138.1 MFS transporter [Dactylosporangium sp.]